VNHAEGNNRALPACATARAVAAGEPDYWVRNVCLLQVIARPRGCDVSGVQADKGVAQGGAMSEDPRAYVYYEGDGGTAVFERRCRQCSRFVQADAIATFDGRGQIVWPNATCRRCGRVQMLFTGWF